MTIDVVTQNFWVVRDMPIHTAFAKEFIGDRYFYSKSNHPAFNLFCVEVVDNKIVSLTSEHESTNLMVYSMKPDHEHKVIIGKFKLNDLPIDIQ